MTKDRLRSFIDAVKRARELMPDELAKDNIEFYPEWIVGKNLKIGDRITFNNALYKVKQAHETQADWQPDMLPSLFEPIDLLNDGSLERPIIAAIGMTYFKDKYYLDETDGKIYLCNRDDSNGNGTIINFMPSALVGHYFEFVK